MHTSPTPRKFSVITPAPHSNYETGCNVPADSTCDIPEVNLAVNPKQYATISSTAACGISYACLAHKPDAAAVKRTLLGF